MESLTLLLSQSSQTAIIKYHRLGLKQHLFLTILETKSEFKVPVWLGSGERPLPGLQMATFLLCLRLAETERGQAFWCLYEDSTLRPHLITIISQRPYCKYHHIRDLGFNIWIFGVTQVSPQHLDLGLLWLPWWRNVVMLHDFQGWLITDSIACEGFPGMLTFGSQPSCCEEAQPTWTVCMWMFHQECTQDPADSQHQPPDKLWGSLREDFSPHHYLSITTWKSPSKKASSWGQSKSDNYNKWLLWFMPHSDG